MLTQLHIQNYAIIDEITIPFDGKMNVITGETGAGKSILMGALSLILGDRADTSVLLDRERKCFVEGTFTAGGKKEVADLFREQDLEAEEEVVIRREISPNGKSRAFVNDTPVNLALLVKSGKIRVDIPEQLAKQAGGGMMGGENPKGYGIFDSAAKKIYVVLDSSKQVIVVDLNKKIRMLTPHVFHENLGIGLEEKFLPLFRQMQPQPSLRMTAKIRLVVRHAGRAK